MPCYFDEKNLTEMREDFRSAINQERILLDRLACRSYRSKKGYEYAFHGLSRRIGTLKHTIEFTFDNIPPQLDTPPNKLRRSNAQMAIQSFYFNIFGAIDNIAWIWAAEKPVIGSDGKAIKKREVILFPKKKNRTLFSSLPEEMQKLITQQKDWYEALLGYRDGLAHRIPLYIPPFSIFTNDLESYHALKEQKYDAARCREFDEYERIASSMSELENWAPFMMHSFEEEACPLIFHVQMIVDMKTLFELCDAMCNALDDLVYTEG